MFVLTAWLTLAWRRSYDFFKQLLLRNRLPLLDYQLKDGLLLHSVASVMAGTVATSEWTTCDARLELTYVSCSHYSSSRCAQVSIDGSSMFNHLRVSNNVTDFCSQHGKTSPVQVLTTALRSEGPRFLFKGWTPAFIRLGPNTVLMFIFFEVRGIQDIVASSFLSL